MIALDSRKAKCPNCGKMIELIIDCSIEQQEYIEDCQVCCRPILINVQIHRKDFDVSVRNPDE
ncbi:CPXCG motif-containing cysteine-rich protein [Endozoicomonas lisbonensis]|uniref:CPXCG motif-containing cysteine-rich protein n=1 Tax=Endozoicomonas lisbonensis TaxID=3120522 RepID=A0ABV2SJ32_9GAMM